MPLTQPWIPLRTVRGRFADDCPPTAGIFWDGRAVNCCFLVPQSDSNRHCEDFKSKETQPRLFVDGRTETMKKGVEQAL